MSIQKQITLKEDYEHALVLGLEMGIFLLPIVNNFFFGQNLIFANILFIFLMPLLAIAFIFFAHLIFGKSKRIWQFVRFFLIGATNTAINFGVLNYFLNATGIYAGWPLVMMSAVSFLAAMINSYIWNSYWAFNDGFDGSVREFDRFILSTIIGLILSSYLVILVSTLLRGFNPYLAANMASLTGVFAGMIWNFFCYKHFVFVKQIKK